MTSRILAALSAFVLGLAALAIVACAGEPDTPRAAPPTKITATTGMIADIVRQVAGERAAVHALMREGVDPHLFKPTRGDVVRLMESDLVFYNGLMLEGKMQDVLERLGGEGKAFAVTTLLERDGTYVLGDPAKPGHHDPHVWMDARGWMKAVEAVAAVLGERDSAGATLYQENARKYVAELARLDEYAKKSIATIAERERVLVTAHDAFNYFGRAYGIEVRGIQGISTESEAGVRDVNELVTLLVERGVRAVFVETSVADKNVRALVEGARSRDHDVAIGGSLFSDAMGASGTYEGTYIGMIDHNVTTITRALGGEVPERGMQGKLGPSSHAPK